MNGLMNDKKSKIIETILNIFQPLFEYFSMIKKTIEAMMLGITLEIIIGTTVKTCSSLMKMSSVIKPIALDVKNNKTLIMVATPAAVKPAINDCLKFLSGM